ncbi:MAG: DUF5618 family protein [Cytophagales bacterium]|nr:DUF5618 family protein [Cytophagales bacterium]
MKIKDKIYRYIDNASLLLTEKAGKDEDFYSDKKYVQMAGNTLWNGVLEALKHKYPEIGKAKGRPNIDKYMDAVAKDNKKMLKHLQTGYNYMHLYMGYDGDLSYNTSRTALEEAKTIINWVLENNNK